MTANSPDSQTFGHYDVESLLGRGAMGTVYLARDRRIGRRVALKTIRVRPDEFSDDDAARDFFGRLQREAEVSGSLLHPNIVTLYEAGYEDGRISYLAMELVEGETLQAVIKRRGGKPAPVSEVLRIAEDVLRALVHAHSRGIIHRDIKPANILITSDGTAKLADFGIARPQDSSMTGAGALIGTPNYMAPEQVLGKTVTTQADVFSLGVVLYEMVTGAKPFAATELTAILHKILRQEVANAADVSPSVSREVGDLVARMMAKPADARPTASAALETVTTLRKPDPVVSPSLVETIPSGPSVAVPLEPPPSSVWRRPIRSLHAAILIGAVAALAIVPATIIATRIDSSPTITIPQAKLDEFRNKREELRIAAEAFDARKYEESLRRYEAYLAKYPHSTVARDGRERAGAALQNEKRPKTTRSTRSRKEDEDISPSELLRRIKKRVLGR